MEEDALINKQSYDIIVIGGSAGSLEVLFDIFSRLSVTRFPILVILHRRGSGDSSLAALLGSRSTLPVKEAEEKEVLLKGRVYLAPADYHLLIEKDGTVSLDASEKVNFSRPSIDVTFESVADVFGQAVVGMLLSGGNTDGVKGLAAIKKAGGLCVVQSPDSAEVPYMPRQAIEQVPVDVIARAEELSSFINQL